MYKSSVFYAIPNKTLHEAILQYNYVLGDS